VLNAMKSWEILSAMRYIELVCVHACVHACVCVCVCVGCVIYPSVSNSCVVTSRYDLKEPLV